ncbi:neuropeptide F-like [Schistocerca nitens]|uniref:neuropeptide F-like n=1 Tax=Schistocerca nitens TaxID=7011 RepID=UPI002118EFF2|nr:neuropeptide F-like [Schistocerca nitens]
MSQSRPLALLVLSAAVVALLLVVTAPTPAEAQQAAADGNKLEGLADALKYLQELDRYYSQVARPSPRSGGGASLSVRSPLDTLSIAEHLRGVEKMVRMLQLQEYDRMYTPRNRPRFGKRSELRPDVVDDVMPEETSADKFWRRFARRR